MTRLRKTSIAAVAGLLVGMLSAGGTYARWHDSNALTTANLKNGLLTVNSATPVWKDVSSDRTDSPHVIDLTTWKAFPGDKVDGMFPFTASLKGDNMVANLGFVDVNGNALSFTNPYNGWTFAYELRNTDDTVVIASTTSLAAVKVAAADNPQKGSLPSVPATGKTFNLFIHATYNPTGTDPTVPATNTTLQNMTVSLAQTRTATGGGY